MISLIIRCRPPFTVCTITDGQINEKPSTKAQKLVPLLRRASLNIGGLQRQKSFDLTEEEETVCQESDVSKRDACRIGRDLARESIREIAEGIREIVVDSTKEAVGEIVSEPVRESVGKHIGETVRKPVKETIGETVGETAGKTIVVEAKKSERASERKDSDERESRRNIGNKRETRDEFAANGRQTKRATSDESRPVESNSMMSRMNESKMDEQTGNSPSDQNKRECFK